MAEEKKEISAKGMVSAVCIDWPKREILTVQNNTDPKKPLGFMGLPGGKIKEGEIPEKAVCRETKQETNQEGKAIMKYVVEIPKPGADGNYVHYFIIVKIISSGNELENNEDPRDTPKWVSLQEIIEGRVKMFRGHVKGCIMLLEKMTEGTVRQGKVNRNGIPILSEAPAGIRELLDEFKKVFDANGGYVRRFVPPRLIRAGYRPFNN
jgi:ADP-ribose pyrophosphatase YjhB (NUDIX family)